MKIRLFLTILLTFAAMNIYAQESTEIVAKMIGGLRADNSKSITIPGKKGAIRIYFESLKTTPYASELIHIDYNDKVSPFQAGSNFVITQDDKLIFGRYDDKIYARGYIDKNNEYVSIKHNNYVYEYSRDNIKIYDSNSTNTVKNYHAKVYTVLLLNSSPGFNTQQGKPLLGSSG